MLVAARLVCVTLGRTRSLMWEIGQLRSLGVLDKAIIVLPPLPAKEARLRLRALAAALGVTWRAVDPGPSSTVLAVVCPAWRQHRPVLLVGGGPDDIAYDAAMRTAIALIEPERPMAPEVQALIESAAAHPRSPDASVTWEPTLRVWAPGAAPVRKGWHGQRVTIAWSLNIVVTSVFAFWTGHDPDQVESVQLQPDLRVTAIAQDLRSEATYGVVDYRHVVRLDPKQKTVRLLLSVDDHISELVVDGDVVVVASGTTGRLTARSLRSGAVLWTAKTPSGFRGLAVDGHRVTVVTPADRTVRSFSLTNGTALRQRRLSGTPWDVTTASGHVFVAVVDRAQAWTWTLRHWLSGRYCRRCRCLKL